jgi:ubiquinone/menaquinone biosynthesis C-methylase UbiE
MANFIEYSSGFKKFLSITKKAIAFKPFTSFIAKHTSGRPAILDVGFGSGVLLEQLLKKLPQSNLHGVDVNENYVSYVHDNIPQANLSVYEGTTLPFPPDSFDAITCIQVVEHMTHPELFFKEAFAILKSGGVLIVTTPNPDGLAARVLGEKWQGIHPGEHISLHPPWVWKNFACNSGFKVIKEGTTLLSGFKILRMFPFSILNGLILLVFGQFKWKYGESYNLFLKKP